MNKSKNYRVESKPKLEGNKKNNFDITNCFPNVQSKQPTFTQDVTKTVTLDTDKSDQQMQFDKDVDDLVDLIDEINRLYDDTTCNQTDTTATPSTNVQSNEQCNEQCNNHDMLFFDDSDEEILNELCCGNGDQQQRLQEQQQKLHDLEKKEYYEAVYDFLKTKYNIEPDSVVLDMVTIEPFPIYTLFDLYIKQFPAGMFTLVYQLDTKVVVTKYTSKKMLCAQSTTETEYEFVISRSNKITFTINSTNKFMNKIVIKAKHRLTTIFYNLDVHVKNLDNGEEHDEKAISLQLFK